MQETGYARDGDCFLHLLWVWGMGGTLVFLIQGTRQLLDYFCWIIFAGLFSSDMCDGVGGGRGGWINFKNGCVLAFQ